MFKRKESQENAENVTIEFEGKKLEANTGETIAAALLASGAGFTTAPRSTGSVDDSSW